MKKKVVILLLAILLVVYTNVITVLAYDTVVVQDGFKYGLDECTGTATVVGPDGECSGKVTIPTIVENQGAVYVVTAIGSGAFRDCSALTSVDLPDTLRCIGKDTFRDCLRLSSVLIPKTTQKIGNDAFNGCISLCAVWFTHKSQLQQIGERAFYGCWSLSGVQIPESVELIGRDAFGRSAASVTSEELCTGSSFWDSSSSLTDDDNDDVFYSEFPESPASV